MLNKDSLIHYLKIFTEVFIPTPGSFFMIGTLLNLAFNPFKCSLKTVLTLLHSSVTSGSNLCKSSCEVDGRDSA